MFMTEEDKIMLLFFIPLIILVIWNTKDDDNWKNPFNHKYRSSDN